MLEPKTMCQEHPPELMPSAEAVRVVELCAGDRLLAWKICYQKALSMPAHREYWLLVADAVVEHQSVPVPKAVAELLARNVVGADPLSAFSDPRVQMWARVVLEKVQ